MQLGTFEGTEYAFSPNAGAGAARFIFEVACPSTYRLFGRVLDDDAGVHGCCDPDSFDVEGPDNLEFPWFYGCDTVAAGWTWAQVETGELGGTCDDPVGVTVSLSAGLHAFTLRNREPAFGSATAGVAELVLTNDINYTP
ncbi:MAG: hypothetical protein KUG77_04100 [Nannocystaceae bacterium]|nr:hypothetical protein [Nannocystaceae bacterium]